MKLQELIQRSDTWAKRRAVVEGYGIILTFWASFKKKSNIRSIGGSLRMHENLNHLPRKHEAQLWKSTTQCLSPIPHASDTVSILLRTPNVPVATLARSGSGMGCLLLHAVHQLRRFITVIPIPTSFAAPSTLHSLHTPFYTRTMGQQAH